MNTVFIVLLAVGSFILGYLLACAGAHNALFGDLVFTFTNPDKDIMHFEFSKPIDLMLDHKYVMFRIISDSQEKHLL